MLFRSPREILCVGGLEELRQVLLTERFVEIGAAVTLGEILELRESAVPELLGLALRMVGTHVVAQRSVHTSVIDGAILAGLRLEFVAPNIDAELGIAHGVTAEALDEQLRLHPGAAAAYVVTPSYFGAAADVAPQALHGVDHAAEQGAAYAHLAYLLQYCRR